MEFRLPRQDERSVIVGRTGSGKTQAAVWQLSLRDYDRKPWIVFDFKGDRLIADIPRTQEISLSDAIPAKPGIYIARPLPHQREEVDDFLARIWATENCGVYADEGYMLTGLKWFRECLTQGRSKSIPMIVLSQRPRHLDRFVWSEADFFQAFTLNLLDARVTVNDWLPGYRDVKLPAFWSIWYSVKDDLTLKLKPVPEADQILDTFKQRTRRGLRLVA